MDKTKARKITKTVTNIAVQYGSGVVIYGIIRNNVDTPKLYQKVAVGVTAYVLSGFVGKAAANYSNEMVDEVFDIIDGIPTKIRFIN